MDLATAQKHLNDSLDALSAARQAIQYGRGNRQLTRASLDDLRKEAASWQRTVNELKAQAAGVSANPTVLTPKWT